VEVAFTDDIADSITPLLDEAGAPSDLSRARTAIFYSISNTQAGLKGVSFGDSLIKRVVETLQAEFPRLRTFATLSPIPGLRAWLARNTDELLSRTPARERDELARALDVDALSAPVVLGALDGAVGSDGRTLVARWLLRCAAHYLGQARVDGRPADAVARFHLGNGARIERLNWGADPSPKGRRQSWGLMVNYLYDLPRLDRNRASLAQGTVAVSGTIDALYF
jgi:malonyl-CoA decarboxylase